MILLRSILFNALFYLGTVIASLLGLPVLLLPRRVAASFGHYWAKWVLWLAGWSAGLRYEVRGRENLPRGPSIVAVKHQSAWDTFAAAALFDDPAIVVKRELFRIPFYGWYLRKAGMIGIDRDLGAGALRRMLTASRAAVAQGRPILIFPEGTRTPVGGDAPYHPGVAALARDLKLPVVPVALNSGLFWGRRAFYKRPGTIVVEILPPLPGETDRRRITDELRSRIETATARLVTGVAAVDKPVDESESVSI
ncbi:MAG: lysophospholipid acyltransferase family protein [Stellaceae bacterium]